MKRTDDDEEEEEEKKKQKKKKEEEEEEKKNKEEESTSDGISRAASGKICHMASLWSGIAPFGSSLSTIFQPGVCSSARCATRCSLTRVIQVFAHQRVSDQRVSQVLLTREQ